jgi:hypothetical protein
MLMAELRTTSVVLLLGAIGLAHAISTYINTGEDREALVSESVINLVLRGYMWPEDRQWRPFGLTAFILRMGFASLRRLQLSDLVKYATPVLGASRIALHLGKHCLALQHSVELEYLENGAC